MRGRTKEKAGLSSNDKQKNNTRSESVQLQAEVLGGAGGVSAREDESYEQRTKPQRTSRPHLPPTARSSAPHPARPSPRPIEPMSSATPAPAPAAACASTPAAACASTPAPPRPVPRPEPDLRKVLLHRRLRTRNLRLHLGRATVGAEADVDMHVREHRKPRHRRRTCCRSGGSGTCTVTGERVSSRVDGGAADGLGSGEASGVGCGAGVERFLRAEAGSLDLRERAESASAAEEERGGKGRGRGEGGGGRREARDDASGRRDGPG